MFVLEFGASIRIGVAAKISNEVIVVVPIRAERAMIRAQMTTIMC